MLKELLQELYVKLEQEEENERKSKTGNFDFFEEHVLTRSQFEKYKRKGVAVTSKTMKNYYEKYTLEWSNDAGEPKIGLLNLISEYLGFDDFKDFKKQNEVIKDSAQQDNDDQIDEIEENNTEEIVKEPDIQITTKVKSWKKTVLVSISILSSLYIAIIINKDVLFNSNECIVWKDDHYEKSSCFIWGAVDNSKHLINIDLFRKVKLDSVANFFTNGKANFWYGKNLEREIEYFTHRGVHPETGEELKPITRGLLAKEGLLNE
ncbi:hypothetical protein [Tenacibaculum amylolyticum]|uniref:hypothetical protein n=1 Tax=Tenacibaculum amylolyticum TaxID=104269 RepID=UPI0038962564